MNEKIKNSAAFLKKISFFNILPFIIWPLVFVAAFYIIYNRMVSLYLQEVEYKGTNAATKIADSFHGYLDQIDDTLKSSVGVVEYMMDSDAEDSKILDYITYQSEQLGIVSATGSRGIFGIFRGKFMHGLGWDPGPTYDPRERNYYQGAASKKGEYTFVGPYFNYRTEEYVVTAVKMLNDNDSVIAFAIDYETFRNMTIGRVGADAEHIVLVMNDDGIVLCRSNDEEMGVNYADSEDLFERSIYNAIISNSEKNTFLLPKGKGVADNYIISKKHVMYDLNVVTVTNLDTELHELKVTAAIFFIILVLGMVIIIFLNFRALASNLRSREQLENIKSISNIYVTLVRIDIPDDTFEQISCTDYRAALVAGDEKISASKMMFKVMPQMVDERSSEAMAEFVDLSTLNERMKFNDTLTVEFLNYEHIWHRARFIVVDRDEQKNLRNVLFATEIIDDEKRARDRFQYLAETDQLTGINNRGSGESKISDLLTKNVGGMFIMFDVDKFKYINDNFGHDTGDAVLIGIAEKMQHTFREKDIIMRLGGDEFAAYTPNIHNEEAGTQVLDRLIDAIHDLQVSKLGDYKIDISIGAAFYYPTDSFSFEELYKRSDSCAYASKKFKGSVYTFYKRMDAEYQEH
jgi:diguanylate cyclase (GGDEF)-like protein